MANSVILNYVAMKMMNSMLVKYLGTFLQVLLKLCNIWNVDKIVDDFFATNWAIKKGNRDERHKIELLIHLVAGKFGQQLLLAIAQSSNAEVHFVNFDFIYFGYIHKDLNMIMLVFYVESGLILRYLYLCTKNNKFLHSITLVRSILSGETKSRYLYFNMQLNYARIRKQVFAIISMHNRLLQQFAAFVGEFLYPK